MRLDGGNWWSGSGAGYLTTTPLPPPRRNVFIVPTIGLSPEQQKLWNEHVHRLAVERFKRKFALAHPI